MARTAQIKQREDYFKTCVSQYATFQEFRKFLQVQSQKPGTTMKLALMRAAIGKKDPELPLRQRISSLELPASEIAAQINVSEFK
jgi:hypothetical protein